MIKLTLASIMLVALGAIAYHSWVLEPIGKKIVISMKKCNG